MEKPKRILYISIVSGVLLPVSGFKFSSINHAGIFQTNHQTGIYNHFSGDNLVLKMIRNFARGMPIAQLILFKLSISLLKYAMTELKLIKFNGLSLVTHRAALWHTLCTCVILSLFCAKLSPLPDCVFVFVALFFSNVRRGLVSQLRVQNVCWP